MVQGRGMPAPRSSPSYIKIEKLSLHQLLVPSPYHMFLLIDTVLGENGHAHSQIFICGPTLCHDLESCAFDL